MRKSIFIAVILLALPFARVWAQGASTAFPYLKIDRSPVTSALAGAGSASTLGAAYAAFSNPAMLPFLEGESAFDSGFTMQFWAPGASKSTNTNVGVAYKINPRIAITGGLALQVAQGYETYDNSGVVNGTYSPTDFILALGAGFAATENLSFGANFHLASSTIASGTSYANVNFDIFAAYRVLDGLKLTAGVSNFGPAVKSYSKQTYPLPTSVKLALDYTLGIGEGLKIDFVADGDYYFSKDFAAAAGANVAWKWLRAGVGYRFASAGAPIPSHLGVGAGLQFGGFTINASYLTASAAIGNTLAIGLGYRF